MGQRISIVLAVLYVRLLIMNEQRKTDFVDAFDKFRDSLTDHQKQLLYTVNATWSDFDAELQATSLHDDEVVENVTGYGQCIHDLIHQTNFWSQS